MGSTISAYLKGPETSIVSTVDTKPTDRSHAIKGLLQYMQLSPSMHVLGELWKFAMVETDAPIEHTFSDKEPQNFLPDLRKITSPLQRLFYNQFSNMVTSARNILEIGAAKLTINGTKVFSHVSNFYSHDDWTFSDIYKPTLTSSLAKYKQLDLLDGSTQPSDDFDFIIGCNVLDELTYDHLEVALKTINNQLKPEGQLIHLADAGYSLSTFINWLASDNPDSILFPGVGGNVGFTALRINKVAYDKILKEAEEPINAIEKTLLTEWGELPFNQQSKAIHRFCHTYPLDELVSLDNRISEIFGSIIERISLLEVFENSLTTAAKLSGFEIVQVSNIQESTLVPVEDFKKNFNKVNDLFYNCLVLNDGFLHITKKSSIPANQILLQGNMRVFIAKKIPSSK